jgi:hypothetical protein
MERAVSQATDVSVRKVCRLYRRRGDDAAAARIVAWLAADWLEFRGSA